MWIRVIWFHYVNYFWIYIPVVAVICWITNSDTFQKRFFPESWEKVKKERKIEKEKDMLWQARRVARWRLKQQRREKEECLAQEIFQEMLNEESKALPL